MKPIELPGVRVPCLSDLNHAGQCAADVAADLGTLCANWARGCNGITDGPSNGHLDVCDDCAAGDSAGKGTK